ncbi:hypothetical protein AB1N83_005143 [Pleurotus pulmonarius]
MRRPEQDRASKTTVVDTCSAVASLGPEVRKSRGSRERETRGKHDDLHSGCEQRYVPLILHVILVPSYARTHPISLQPSCVLLDLAYGVPSISIAVCTLSWAEGDGRVEEGYSTNWCSLLHHPSYSPPTSAYRRPQRAQRAYVSSLRSEISISSFVTSNSNSTSAGSNYIPDADFPLSMVCRPLPPSSHISSPLVYSLAIPSLVKSTPISSSNELGLKYLEYTPKRSEGTLSKEEKGGLYARRWIDASI